MIDHDPLWTFLSGVAFGISLAGFVVALLGALWMHLK